MIKPVNGHLLIEPLKQDNFIVSQDAKFQEIGIVLDNSSPEHAPVGSRVYFDSWLSAKFPDGKDGFYWLVKWEDVRAVEYVEQ